MWDNTKKAVRRYRDSITQRARYKLKQKDKVVSGQLINSIKGQPLKQSGSNFTFDITMAEYGKYQDEGVSGVEKKYNTRFKFTNKMPPPSKLDKWMVRRGIAPRDAKGRLVSRKSLQFLIARSIYKNGIKPTYFLQESVSEARSKYMSIIREAMVLDIEENLK